MKLFSYNTVDTFVHRLSGLTKLICFLLLTFAVMYSYDIRVVCAGHALFHRDPVDLPHTVLSDPHHGHLWCSFSLSPTRSFRSFSHAELGVEI
jgi:hypothetical protein